MSGLGRFAVLLADFGAGVLSTTVGLASLLSFPVLLAAACFAVRLIRPAGVGPLTSGTNPAAPASGTRPCVKPGHSSKSTTTASSSSPASTSSSPAPRPSTGRATTALNRKSQCLIIYGRLSSPATPMPPCCHPAGGARAPATHRGPGRRSCSGRDGCGAASPTVAPGGSLAAGQNSRSYARSCRSYQVWTRVSAVISRLAGSRSQ
jgi:hypothetical protein